MGQSKSRSTKYSSFKALKKFLQYISDNSRYISFEILQKQLENKNKEGMLLRLCINICAIMKCIKLGSKEIIICFQQNHKLSIYHVN